ncbi:MAG: PKD domain-containing protein [Bacteroidota bacterium]|nr:MAG: PKD domain-containing protein [Bacteroidota bacterium]
MINLDATCSTPAFSGNVYYEWFADGVPYAAWPFPYFQIPFSTPGAHTISLAITDASIGCSDSSAQSINIPVNCTATFQPYQSGNYTYFYSNNYSTTASYFWDFGDGNTSTSMTPAHIYSNPGTYNVCLTISDTAFGGVQLPGVIV